MSLAIEFIVRRSSVPERIGTLTTRTLTLVENIEAPTIEYDEAQAVSMDKLTTQRTVIAESEILTVTYAFPTTELDADDEFRRSALGSNDTIEIDCTDYPWINRTLTATMQSGPITTKTVGNLGEYLRRSFSAMVLSSE